MAAFILASVTVILTAVSWITIAMLGNVDNGATFAGYIGLLLTAGIYISIGIFASSLTSSQIVAFLLAIVISLAFYAVQFFMPILPPSLATFFEFSSINYHLQNMSRGVLDSRDLIYYFSMIFLFLYLAIKAIESRKWRSA
jgi:ABC-2 type transport system permease protein